MYRRLDNPDTVTITVDGEAVEAAASTTLAAALLTAGFTSFRSSIVTGAPRAPYCLMGICNDCLVEIDGRPNQPACLTPVRDGMSVGRSVTGRSDD